MMSRLKIMVFHKCVMYPIYLVDMLATNYIIYSKYNLNPLKLNRIQVSVLQSHLPCFTFNNSNGLCFLLCKIKIYIISKNRKIMFFYFAIGSNIIHHLSLQSLLNPSLLKIFNASSTVFSSKIKSNSTYILQMKWM